MNAFQRPLLIEDFNYRPPRRRDSEGIVKLLPVFGIGYMVIKQVKSSGSVAEALIGFLHLFPRFVNHLV